MKAIGKIGALIITFMVVASIFLFINIETYGIDGGMRFRAFQLLLIIGIPWFISYSKWANDNIWNTKTTKSTNTSYTSSKEVVEAVDDNRNILSNINSPSLSNPVKNNNDVLQKIEELKRQIESLESSLKTNDSNKLPEEKIDYGEYWKTREKFNPDNFKHKTDAVDNEIIVYIIIVLGVLTILGVVGYSM